MKVASMKRKEDEESKPKEPGGNNANERKKEETFWRSYLEMKNEQDLLIFPWGTNVSRPGDSTTPESTQDDDDDRK